MKQSVSELDRALRNLVELSELCCSFWRLSELAEQVELFDFQKFGALFQAS